MVFRFVAATARRIGRTGENGNYHKRRKGSGYKQRNLHAFLELRHGVETSVPPGRSN
jgi:hypothetical protein